MAFSSYTQVQQFYNYNKNAVWLRSATKQFAVTTPDRHNCCIHFVYGCTQPHVVSVSNMQSIRAQTALNKLYATVASDMRVRPGTTL
eukprot:12039-Heterococcus_DN1.PRE.1